MNTLLSLLQKNKLPNVYLQSDGAFILTGLKKEVSDFLDSCKELSVYRDAAAPKDPLPDVAYIYPSSEDREKLLSGYKDVQVVGSVVFDRDIVQETVVTQTPYPDGSYLEDTQIKVSTSDWNILPSDSLVPKNPGRDSIGFDGVWEGDWFMRTFGDTQRQSIPGKALYMKQQRIRSKREEVSKL